MYGNRTRTLAAEPHAPSVRARARPRAATRTLLAALVAGVALAPPSGGATPPGTDLVNVAACRFFPQPGPEDPGGSPGETQGILVLSNPVVTTVSAAAVFEPLTLAVTPAGTVAPATTLRYALTAGNGGAASLDEVELRLPLDADLGAPLSLTSGRVRSTSGVELEVAGAYDPLQREVVWRLASLPAGETVVLGMDAAVDPGTPAEALVEMTGHARAALSTAEADSNTVVTPVMPPVLRVTKRVDRAVAVPGDAVLFEIEVAHVGTAPGLVSVDLVDRLPEALRYVAGTLRVDGVAGSDPVVEAGGGVLRVPLGAMAPGEARLLRLATRVGPAERRSTAINRAVASGVSEGGVGFDSPEATAAVTIDPGPFRTDGFVSGRVFVDDDGDGIPGIFEPGVPGVVVRFEDGRGAVTDVTGRWHLEGVRPGTHVLRLDPDSLPRGIEPVTSGIEWGGDRGTRFLEVRTAELAIADMPVGPGRAPRCALFVGAARLDLPAAVLAADEGRPESAAAALLERAADWFVGWSREPGATSIRCDAAPGIDDASLARLDTLFRGAVAARRPTVATAAGARAAVAEGPVPEPELEGIVRSRSATAAIVSPASGSRADRSSIDVQVAYPIGTTPRLRVNGREISVDRIGSTATLPSRGLHASSYVGVRLEVGDNRIEFEAKRDDPAAPPEPPVVSIVRLAGTAVELRLTPSEGPWVADGVTPLVLRIEAVDSAGVRASSAPVVTVRIEGTSALDADADPTTEGHQVRLREGAATVRFQAPTLPGRLHALAFAEQLETELDLDVLPAAGRWRVAGLAEGTLAGEGGVEGDGGLPSGLGAPLTDDGGRLALWARGPVGGASRLTVAIDTARDRDADRLFGAFEPDLFFPVSGDTSLAIRDAERQGKVFARLDGPLGYAMIGDFSTRFERTELARYDRRMPGIAGRVGSGRVAFDAFAASNDQVAIRDVFAADGTSGPYRLSRRPIVARSETVVVEVRDRFKTDEVLSRSVKRSDLDYDLDPEAGTILFRGPVAPFDRDLNPTRVVVLYEARGGGSDRITAGARLAVRPHDRVDFGLTAVREGRGGDDMNLVGADLAWRPAPGTLVGAEVAATDDGEDRATAWRLDLRSRPKDGLDIELGYRDLPANFANTSYLGSPELGSRRARGAIVWTPDAFVRIKTEAFRQSDEIVGLTRSMIGVEGERRFAKWTALGAVRRVASEGPGDTAADATLLEGGVRGELAPRWTAELVRRQVVDGGGVPGYPTRTAAGIGYAIADGRQAFLRYEIEQGEGVGGADRDRTILGIESRIGPNTRATAAYAMEGGAAGTSLRSTAGIETEIPLTPASRLTLSAARQATDRGETGNDFTSVAAGYEFRAGPSLLAARYEIRRAPEDTRHLLTASGAFRLSEPWTLFVRERIFASDPRSASRALRAEGLIGAAWRPAGGRWQLLARLDHETGSGIPLAPGAILPGGAVSEPVGSLGTSPAPTGPAAIGTSISREVPAALRDAVSLNLAVGARVAARQRLSWTWIVRRAGGDASIGLPASLTYLAALHYTAEVHPRWTVGGSLRRFDQRDSGRAAHGVGAEVGYLVFRNFWVTGGYNVAGFRDRGFPVADRTARGPFVSFRFKFDESSLATIRDLRLDRP